MIDNPNAANAKECHSIKMRPKDLKDPPMEGGVLKLRACIEKHSSFCLFFICFFQFPLRSTRLKSFTGHADIL